MEEEQQVPTEIGSDAAPEMVNNPPPPVGDAAGGPHATPPPEAKPGNAHTEMLTTDRVPVDQLAQMEYDKSILFFGIVPLVAVCGVLLVYVALYFYRRGKQWNELGEAMRLEDEPATASKQSGFSTAELADLEPTRPSERLRKVDED